jgi:predicted permease
VDASVVLFALAISLVAGIVFGVLPLPQQLRRPLHGLARESRGQIGTRERQHIRKALIVTQIALAVVLVTGSGLMLRSFQRVRAIEPGIRPEGVATLGVSIDRNTEKTRAAATYQRILDELRRLPGVQYAAATNALPLDPGGMNGGSFRIKSKPRADTDLPPVTMYLAISDDYLKTIGSSLVQGRTIERADQEQRRDVVVVNQAFARQFLDNHALGEHIAFGDDSTHWFEIVGVVADVRTFDLRQEVRPFVYLPLNAAVSTMSINTLSIVLRSTGDPLSLVTPARAVIRGIDPNIPITTARTMRQVVSESEARSSFTLTILLIAALVALLLGAIGLYGVINYVVTQRTSEIGVRMALGAIPNQVRALVLSQGMRLGVAGVLIGVLGAIGVTRVLETLLFEVKTRDPLTFVIVPVIMLGVTFLAAYVPARRASTVSPLEALRAD